ncbi:GSCOCG00009945001-RA-CDS, partial [Cotesia congregata]
LVYCSPLHCSYKPVSLSRASKSPKLESTGQLKEPKRVSTLKWQSKVSLTALSLLLQG